MEFLAVNNAMLYRLQIYHFTFLLYHILYANACVLFCYGIT